jgi:hypothetical protein
MSAVTAHELPSNASNDGDPPFVLDRRRNLAFWVFVGVEVLALAFYLYAGRQRWFFHDEWNVLITRDGGDVDDLLTPGNEHWTTVPMIVYRVFFNIFGINTYVPYQLVSITLHLAAAALLRVVMIRATVSAWLATVVAGIFVLFGSGDHNILRAFQMTFGGALTFGLIQLVLATGPRRSRWTDALGLLAGLVAIMCSGVGIAMVAAVGIAVLLQRGWRAALFHVVPLTLVYVLWWSMYARDEAHVPITLRQFFVFSWSAVWNTFVGISQVPLVGIGVIVVTVAGLVLAWRHLGSDEVRRRAAGPVGLLVGAVVFVGLTAWSRATLGPVFAEQSRYMHIIAALVLPAIAVAADAIARRWSVAIPIVLVLLLVGIPGNVLVSWHQEGKGRGERSDRAVYLAFAPIAEAEGADDYVRPDPRSAAPLTLGWLRDGIADGRVPVPDDIPSGVAAEARLRLSLQLSQIGWPVTACEPIERRDRLHLEQGQAVGLRGTARVYDANVSDDERVALTFEGGKGRALTAYRGPLDLVISPQQGDDAALCTILPAR